MAHDDALENAVYQHARVSSLLTIFLRGILSGLSRVKGITEGRRTAPIKLTSGRQRLTWCAVPYCDDVPRTYER